MTNSPDSGDPLDEVAIALFRRVSAEEFRCLPSFLFAIADSCAADEASVVSVDGDSLSLLRTSRANTSFDKLRSVLKEELSAASRTSSAYARSLWTDSKHLILRRIWPASNWHTKPGESFWLYVLNPRLMAPAKYAPDHEAVTHLGAFVRWKNELYTRQRELLSHALDDADRVVSELRKLVVRPVRPDHFFEILTLFRPTKVTPFQWAAHVEELERACRRPRQCYCHAVYEDRWEAGEIPFECPQTPANDSVLSTLAKLEVWRTGFWKQQWTNERDERQKLLERALAGLREAASLLRWNDSECCQPIDFNQGAAGLKGERALLRYFCAHAIQRTLDKCEGAWQSTGFLPTDLDFPAKLASLASTLIGSGHWTPDAIQNLLQVVALFGHRVLDIPSRIDLVRHLQQTLRGETALHTLKARYRDHFFHTLEVCFLGFTILTSRPDRTSDKTFGAWLLEQCLEYQKMRGAEVQLPPLPTDETDLLRQWWTASLIHDTAYGIDIHDGTLKLLEFFTKRKELKTFIDEAHGAVARMSEGLSGIAPELKGDHSLKKGDHGVIAAASLLDIVRSIGDKTSAGFLSAVRAIAFHNTRHPAVDAGLDPVAALLILCDSVQEWGRSSLGFNRSPSVLLSRMMEAASTPAEEQFGPVKRYGLSLTPDVNGANVGYVWNNPNELSIELDYGEEVLRECQTKFIWADLTYNLQRVNFGPWEVSLRLQVSTPLPADGTTRRTQIEYLSDFIQEQEVRFVEDWFNMAIKRDQTQAVCHRIARRNPENEEWADVQRNELGARELITLNLPELSKAYCEEHALMGGNVGDFARAMMAWSLYVRELADNPPAQRPPV